MRQAKIPSFGLALILGLLAPPLSAQEAPSTPPLFVQTHKVEPSNGTSTRQFFGRISALETAALSFEVGGYLAFLEAREGARVGQGELLAELDVAPFERAVARAELSLAQAERDLTRAQELASRNVTSEVRSQDAETARDLAEVALTEARDALDDARISAPFDGMIADRVANSFTTVAPGEPIVRLHNLSEIRVEFELPERLLSEIGNPSRVSFEAVMPSATDPIPLLFREFRAETGRVGQSYTISLAVTGEIGPLMIPGKTVSVRASVPRVGNGYRVPSTAVGTSSMGEQYVVALRSSDDALIASHVPVEVSTRNGTDILVSGLEPGDEIVAVGAHLVPDGQAVRRYAGLTVEGN